MIVAHTASASTVHLYGCDRREPIYHPRLPNFVRRYALQVRGGNYQAAGGDLLIALAWARRIAEGEGLSLTVTRPVADELAEHGIHAEPREE